MGQTAEHVRTIYELVSYETSSTLPRASSARTRFSMYRIIGRDIRYPIDGHMHGWLTTTRS